MKKINGKNINKNETLKSFFTQLGNIWAKFFPKKTGITIQHMKHIKFDTLKLFGSKKKNLDEVNKEASNILKQHFNDINGLFKFIELRGTKVIRCKNADIVALLFGEVEGFITPISGLRGKLFLLCLKIIGAWHDPIYDKTPAMFVFGKNAPPMGYMVHQIHHWISFNKGLPGYSEDTMNNFKRIFDPSFGYDDVQKMSKEEVLELREAIGRDKDALEFVKQMAQELLNPNEIIKDLHNGESRNI